MPLPKGNLNRPTVTLISLMNQPNNFTDGEKENEFEFPNFKYREIDYFQQLSKNFERKSLSFFHMKYIYIPKTLMILIH